MRQAHRRARTRDQAAGTDRAVRGLLSRTARRGGGWLWLLAFTALAASAAQLAFPATLGRAVDAIVGQAPHAWITWTSLLVAVLMACDAADDLAAGGATARSTSWLRRCVLHQILSIGPRAGARFPAGEVASRLGANSADAGRIGPYAVRALANVMVGLGSAIALAFIDPWLCLTFVLGLALLTGLARAFGREASVTAEAYLASQGAIAARLIDAVGGARTIAAAGTLDREVERVLAPLPDLRRYGEQMWVQQAGFGALDALVVPLLVVAVVAVAGLELAKGRITPGALISAGQYAMLGTVLSSAFMSVGRLARSRAGARRAAEVLAVAPVIYGDADLPSGAGCLEFRGVAASVEGRQVLHDVSFCVQPGALVALVGRTGAGKSLLAGLAARLLDPDEGEVLLDGVALDRLPRDVLRRTITYAFERPVLLGETLGDAIAFGAEIPGRDIVEAAAAAAQAEAFIRRLPGGFDTPLRQAPMSGGEVQRVGLARAFAHAGRIIVFDDVVASLDTVTEHEISRVLTGALAGRTRIIVAQRASTAARADAVVWLDGGIVRAMAPHASLWVEAGYRALFEPELQGEHGDVVTAAGTGEPG